MGHVGVFAGAWVGEEAARGWQRADHLDAAPLALLEEPHAVVAVGGGVGVEGEGVVQELGAEGHQ